MSHRPVLRHLILILICLSATLSYAETLTWIADENVVDDETDGFAGHYADDVTVMVTTPTPVTATTWSGVKAIYR